ncbi:phosphotransferase family protein [Legionella clemsonensis]|uniref:Phosphotransferase enzyme family protein n=1 Tax=Legionella clemsonensis TaxID=1867846 RepID=A0A222NZC9_9GAMM|nr:phosphotransferase [Legionella clemsonensis]ASQ44954.1 Phosphotransferase enzyme family protein [Legionella clemsonensis]
MNNQHWSGQFFKQSIQSIVPLKESYPHQTDLVILQDGSQWVCKILTKNTWLGPIDSTHFVFTEQVASCVAQKLDCTFAPLSLEEGRQQSHSRYLIVPYCQGKLVTVVTQEQAMALGCLLAKLHELSLSHLEAQEFPRIYLPTKHTHPAWLELLVRRCNALCHYEKASRVVSHRDIHLQNVIWKTAKEPYLIDWESAGLIHPFVELIGLAINCSGLANYQFNKLLFQATLKGYAYQKGKLPRSNNNLWEMCLHSWLLWYAYSLKKEWYADAQSTLRVIELIRVKMPELQATYAAAMK